MDLLLCQFSLLYKIRLCISFIKNNKDLRRLRSLVLLQLKDFHVTFLVSVPLYNKGVMLQTGSPGHSSILHLGCSSKSLGISLSLIGITKTKASFLMSSSLPLHYFLIYKSGLQLSSTPKCCIVVVYTTVHLMQRHIKISSAAECVGTNLNPKVLEDRG